MFHVGSQVRKGKFQAKLNFPAVSKWSRKGTVVRAEINPELPLKPFPTKNKFYLLLDTPINCDFELSMHCTRRHTHFLISLKYDQPCPEWLDVLTNRYHAVIMAGILHGQIGK